MRLVDPEIDYAAQAREMIVAAGYPVVRREHVNALAALLACWTKPSEEGVDDLDWGISSGRRGDDPAV